MSNDIIVSSGYDPSLFKEYCNMPSRVIRGIKSCNLPSKAREIWEIVYDSGKYDLNREVYGLTIDKIQQIIGAKSRRTPEMHLATLVKLGYLEITPNYSESGRRLPNTYKPLIPQELLQKMADSTVKLSVIPRNPIIPRNVETEITPSLESYNFDSYHNSTYDDLGYPVEPDVSEHISRPSDISNECSSEVANEPNEASEAVMPTPAKNCGTYNYHEEVNININNCYSLSAKENEKEVVKIFPSIKQPQNINKACIKHMIKSEYLVEPKISDILTETQKRVIDEIISFWKFHRYVSSIKDCRDWIISTLLNPKALSGCGKSFLKKVNTIIKLIREKRFSKPFTIRYNEKEQYTTNQSKKLPANSVCSSQENGTCPEIPKSANEKWEKFRKQKIDELANKALTYEQEIDSNPTNKDLLKGIIDTIINQIKRIHSMTIWELEEHYA